MKTFLIALLFSVALSAQYTPPPGGRGCTSSGAAGTVQVAGSSAGTCAGDPLVGKESITGGAYYSATADATGGGPNQCPIWYWGDNTCQLPSALILNANISGDLSVASNEYATLATFGNFTHTGSSGGFAIGADFETNFSGSGPYSSSTNAYYAATYSGSGSASALAGLSSHVIVLNTATGTVGQVLGNVTQITNNGLNIAPLGVGYYAYGSQLGSTGFTTFYGFYGDDLGGQIVTNPYYSWFDSRGVRRVKEDSTFDSVGQAIEALYNPLFAKYAPGAANYERIVLGEWKTNVAAIGTECGGTGTCRATAILSEGKTCTINTTTGVWTCV